MGDKIAVAQDVTDPPKVTQSLENFQQNTLVAQTKEVEVDQDGFQKALRPVKLKLG